MPPGSQLADPAARHADLPARFTAAWLAGQLQPAWDEPLSYILPYCGGRTAVTSLLMGLPYGGNLDEQEANTLQLLYGHAARRWYDTAREAAKAEVAEPKVAAGPPEPAPAPAHAPAPAAASGGHGSAPAEAVRLAAERLAADIHANMGGEQPGCSAQPGLLVGSLRRLALAALRLGLLVRASHPLLRVCASPLPPAQGRDGGQGLQVHALLQDGRQVEVRCVRVKRSATSGSSLHPAGVQQEQQAGAGDWGGGSQGTSNPGRTSSPEARVLCTVRPGACYVPTPYGVFEAKAQPEVLVQEEVLTWAWVSQGPPHSSRRSTCTAPYAQQASSSPGSAPSGPGAGGRGSGAAGELGPGGEGVGAGPNGETRGGAREAYGAEARPSPGPHGVLGGHKAAGPSALPPGSTRTSRASNGKGSGSGGSRPGWRRPVCALLTLGAVALILLGPTPVFDFGCRQPRLVHISSERPPETPMATPATLLEQPAQDTSRINVAEAPVSLEEQEQQELGHGSRAGSAVAEAPAGSWQYQQAGWRPCVREYSAGEEAIGWRCHPAGQERPPGGDYSAGGKGKQFKYTFNFELPAVGRSFTGASSCHCVCMEELRIT